MVPAVWETHRPKGANGPRGRCDSNISRRARDMRIGVVLTAALAVAIGYGSAGAILWPGGDDGGYLTLDKAGSKCEQKAAGNLGKLAGAIIKCQDKLVQNAFKL